MGIQRPGVDSLQVRKFLVRIDRIAEMGFTEVTPPEVDSGVSTYRRGNDPDYPTKQPGLKNYPDITLTIGEVFGAASFFAEWEKNKDRRAVEVVRLTHEGDVEARLYKLHGAFPKGFKVGDFDASSEDGLALESLTIAYEYCEFY